MIWWWIIGGVVALGIVEMRRFQAPKRWIVTTHGPQLGDPDEVYRVDTEELAVAIANNAVDKGQTVRVEKPN